jgi:archaellum biogenesis ATPase FlaH
MSKHSIGRGKRIMIKIKETDNGTYGVYDDSKMLKEFTDFHKAEMYKEQYILDNDLPVENIEAEMIKNIEIKIPSTIRIEKYKTIEIEENTLTLFAGKPANGKTLFMCDFMRECIAEGYKCVFFSLEMSKENIKKRYNNDKDLIWKNDLLILKDRNGMRIKDLETSIKYIIKSTFGKPDFIFIDYIQYIAECDNYSIKDFANELKRLAKKYKVRIVCAAQLTSGFNIDKINDIADCVAGSREIAKTSENIIVCYKSDGAFHMEVGKCRNGENGPETHLTFDIDRETMILQKREQETPLLRRAVITHEVGHLLTYYFLTGNIGEITIGKDGSGKMIGMKIDDFIRSEVALKVLLGGVVFEQKLNDDAIGG